MSRFSLLMIITLAVLLTMTSCARSAPSPASEPSGVAPGDNLATPFATSAALELDVQASPSECLQGIWRMDEDSFNTLITTLLPMPNLGVLSGTISLSFEQDLYIYALDDITIRFTSSVDNYIQGSGSVSSSGSFTVDGNTILFNNTSTAGEISNWEALINGELTTYPGDPPTLFFTMPGSGTFTCSGDTLTIDTTGTANTPTRMSFQRIN